MDVNRRENFKVRDITLRDDGYHGSSGRPVIEWWYFDAIFENGYSVNTNVAVFSMGQSGVVIPILNIYKDTKPVFCRRGIRNKSKFYLSRNRPHVKYLDEEIINGTVDNKTGNWVYDVKMTVGGQRIELQFDGLMKGWKGRPPGSRWASILPSAVVKGTLTLHGKKIEVTGMGYHDHNWDADILRPERGWYWGRFRNRSLNLVWAKILSMRGKPFKLAVLNEGESNVISIKPENIRFAITRFNRDGWRRIPADFLLEVDDAGNSLFIHVVMKTIEFNHHVKTPFVNYWRFHTRTTGTISYRSRTENVDTMQILEYAKFF